MDLNTKILWAIAIGVATIIAVLLVTAGFHSANADGMEVSTKDGYSDSYSARTMRGSWTCPPEFSRGECRRIRAEVETRRAREVRRQRSRYAEQVTPRVLRYADGGSERRSFGGKRCVGTYSVTGSARWPEKLARSNARAAWRRTVREAAGESYMDERFSPNFSDSSCHIVGDRGILSRCVARGIACRS